MYGSYSALDRDINYLMHYNTKGSHWYHIGDGKRQENPKKYAKGEATIGFDPSKYEQSKLWTKLKGKQNDLKSKAESERKKAEQSEGKDKKRYSRNALGYNIASKLMNVPVKAVEFGIRTKDRINGVIKAIGGIKIGKKTIGERAKNFGLFLKSLRSKGKDSSSSASYGPPTYQQNFGTPKPILPPTPRSTKSSTSGGSSSKEYKEETGYNSRKNNYNGSQSYTSNYKPAPTPPVDKKLRSDEYWEELEYNSRKNNYNGSPSYTSIKPVPTPPADKSLRSDEYWEELEYNSRKNKR